MGPNYPEVAQQVRCSPSSSSSSESESSDSEPLHSDGEEKARGTGPGGLDHDLISTAQAAQDALRSFNAAQSSAPGVSYESTDSGYREAENRQINNLQNPELAPHDAPSSSEQTQNSPAKSKNSEPGDGSPDQTQHNAFPDRKRSPSQGPGDELRGGDGSVKSPDLRLHPISTSQETSGPRFRMPQDNGPQQSLPSLSQLTQLAEAAEKKSFDGRSNAVTHSGPSFHSNGTGPAHQPTGATTNFSGQDPRMLNQFIAPSNPQPYREHSALRRLSSESGPTQTSSHGGYHETSSRTNGYGQARELPSISSPSQSTSPDSNTPSTYSYYTPRRHFQVPDHGVVYHTDAHSLSTAIPGAEQQHGIDRYSTSSNHSSSNHPLAFHADHSSHLRYSHSPATASLSTSGFRCEYPGCTAPPFQTQYLLNSHATVHSQLRPHFCSVPGCPRGVGGRGFKRKNEMIRHGLVHESPGYRCPFCPDREHKYPRPDNLQRHVRVHHMEIDRDDPQLREVLAQRPQGGSRGRRRRLGG